MISVGHWTWSTRCHPVRSILVDSISFDEINVTMISVFSGRVAPFKSSLQCQASTSSFMDQYSIVYKVTWNHSPDSGSFSIYYSELYHFSKIAFRALIWSNDARVENTEGTAMDVECFLTTEIKPTAPGTFFVLQVSPLSNILPPVQRRQD